MYSNLEIIGMGAEGTVYKYNDTEAIKIYTSTKSESISKRLLNIRLKSIITPNELIYKNGLFLGYKMKLIKDIKSLALINKRDLLDGLEIIKEDLKVLSNSGILANDLIPKNSLYSNSGLYFIDTGVYSESSADIETLNRINEKSLERYVSSLVGESTQSLDGRKKIKNLGVNIIEILEDKMNNEETLEEFSKRIIK